MIKKSFLAAALLLFYAITCAYGWQELKGEHFLIYFTGKEKFAKETLDKSEVYYRQIASDLGYQRYSEFWSWEKRVKIYIHPDRESFLKATSQPEWSEGLADYTNKQIISYAWSKGFLESLLPHEIAHLVFRDFVGFKGEVPLWLDEGVAQWTEEAKRAQVKRVAKNLLNQGALISLSDMMRLDVRNMKQEEKTYVRPLGLDKNVKPLYLSADKLVSTYYVQSVSLVSFLIERYGSNSFTVFCRQLRDGKNLEEALRFAYSEYIRSLDELEKKWKEYLMEG